MAMYSVVYVYVDQCMLYLNHVVAVMVVKEPIYKGRSIQETKSSRFPDPNSEVNAADGDIYDVRT